MDKYKEMLHAASGAIKYIFNPNYNDRILLLTDKDSCNIAKAFEESFHTLNCLIDTYIILDKDRPLKEIPKELEALLPGKTIVLNIIKGHL